tara:strand:- start:188 stop:1516 length:1329 start_codon:yes stop_codon:yes gene_type:complete
MFFLLVLYPQILLGQTIPDTIEIYLDPDFSLLPQEATISLDQAAEELNKNSSLKIHVTDYASSQLVRRPQDHIYDSLLVQARFNEIFVYLTKKGVSSSQIDYTLLEIESYDSTPKVCNKNENNQCLLRLFYEKKEKSNVQEQLPYLPKKPNGKISLFFDIANSEVKDEYKDEIKNLAAWLSKQPEDQLKIEAFADKQGTVELNALLTSARAISVYRYLVQLGVNTSNIDLKSFGEAKASPLTKVNEDGKEYNQSDRRVDLIYMEKEKPKQPLVMSPKVEEKNLSSIDFGVYHGLLQGTLKEYLGDFTGLGLLYNQHLQTYDFEKTHMSFSYFGKFALVYSEKDYRGITNKKYMASTVLGSMFGFKKNVSNVEILIPLGLLINFSRVERETKKNFFRFGFSGGVGFRYIFGKKFIRSFVLMQVPNFSEDSLNAEFSLAFGYYL